MLSAAIIIILIDYHTILYTAVYIFDYIIFILYFILLLLFLLILLLILYTLFSILLVDFFIYILLNIDLHPRAYGLDSGVFGLRVGI